MAATHIPGEASAKPRLKPEKIFSQSRIWAAETLHTREHWGEVREQSIRIRYADGASGVIVARHPMSRRQLWEQDGFTFTITIDTQSGSLVFSNFTGEFGSPLPAKSLDKACAELDALANDSIAAIG